MFRQLTTKFPTSDRRAQYLVAGSTVASNSDVSALAGDDDDDEEAQNPVTRAFRFDEEQGDSDEEDIEGVTSGSPRPRENSFVNQIQWDEDYDAVRPSAWQQRQRRERRPHTVIQEAHHPETEYGTRPTVTAQAPSSEQTPLLRKVSFSVVASPRRISETPTPDRANLAPGGAQYQSPNAFARRRFSGSAVGGAPVFVRGHSTFGQTVSSLSTLRFVRGPGAKLCFSAFQFNRDPAWGGDAVRAFGICLCWVGRWLSAHYLLRLRRVLYVGFSSIHFTTP